MTDLQLEQHREAYRVVMTVFLNSVHISHEDERNVDWDVAGVYMPDVWIPGCPTCGDQPNVVGLTTKCRDWHEVCQCGQRYDQPKAKSCRRRKHVKEER